MNDSSAISVMGLSLSSLSLSFCFLSLSLLSSFFSSTSFNHTYLYIHIHMRTYVFVHPYIFIHTYSYIFLHPYICVTIEREKKNETFSFSYTGLHPHGVSLSCLCPSILNGWYVCFLLLFVWCTYSWEGISDQARDFVHCLLDIDPV